MSLIRTLIVDDERLARRRIRGLLELRPEVQVVGECENGEEAVRSIVEDRPDVVFLDVRMPDMDGFTVLEQVGFEELPVVIFVTAFDDYAVRAFDVHAVDYLLKPFEDERFVQAFDRASAQCQTEDAGRLRRQLRALLDEPETRSGPRRIVVRTGGRTSFLSQAEVDWVEADGCYVRLHCGEQAHLLRESMGRLVERLDAEQFERVHRSRIVNLDRVEKVLHGARGALTLILSSGVRIPVSQKHRPALRERLGL